jgi:uncharacterized protein YbjT (DUF2867 family)
MILITGATGTIGSEVLKLLAERGERVRAVTRSPDRLPPDLDVVRADFDDPDTLGLAMTGVDALFLLTAPAKPTPDHDLAALDAATRAGVGTVVKLSAIGTGETIGGRTVGGWHLAAERAVQDSGMAWTVLRPSSFASNFLRFAQPIAAGGPVPNMTGDARQGVVDPRDVAAVAVEALTTSDHKGQTYALTGPEALSVPDQAAILAAALGRAVETVDVPADAARADILGHGMDASAVDAVLTGVEWARAGHNAVVTEDVAEVLGRPATSFATWVRDHLAAFR